MAGLEDLLPFEPRVYWRLFALENEAVWPAQPLLLAAGALLAFCLLRGWRPSARWLGPALAAAWLWAGWQFVALRYGTVNWVAPALAWGFYAETALWRRSASRAGCFSPGAGDGLRPPSGFWRRRFWPGRSSRDSTDEPGARRRSLRSRPIRPPPPRSPCLRSRGAAGGRPSYVSYRRYGLRSPRSPSLRWGPGRVGWCLRPCSPASRPAPHPRQDLQATRELHSRLSPPRNANTVEP